jgi:hypothetical protein
LILKGLCPPTIILFLFRMDSLSFCGPSSRASGLLHSLAPMGFDLHQQMAEQFCVYPSPTANTLSVAERLAGVFYLNVFFSVIIIIMAL